jgi:CRISPR-associated protein Csx14
MNIRINVDPANPGQFFACCGLLELADRLWPAAEVMATFSNDAFHLQSNDPGISVKGIVADLLDAPRVADAPWRTINGADRKPVKDVKKITPVHVGGKINLRLSWWLDELEGRLSALKTWSAHKTSTGLLTDLSAAVDRKALSEHTLLQLSTGMTARFGFDPRSSWNTLDTGFSPNDQNLPVQTFAATELLAAIGIQTFRPSVSGDSFVYACWKHALPAPIARAVASGVVDIQTLTVYRFQIRSRGKFKFFTQSKLWTGSSNG